MADADLGFASAFFRRKRTDGSVAISLTIVYFLLFTDLKCVADVHRHADVLEVHP